MLYLVGTQHIQKPKEASMTSKKKKVLCINYCVQ